MELSPYRNALEPIIVEEVKRQLQDFPPKLVSYINPAQVIAFALNQLPPYIALAKNDGIYNRKKAKEKFAPQIQLAVYRGFLILQADPFKPADLKLSE